MIELKNTSFNKKIAEDTSNILLPDAGAVANGIGFKSNINSNSLNGYFNLLSETVQYLQFTGGLYNKAADYHEGNIASLVIKKGNDYSIKHFKRNSNNSNVLNNNPPIKEANILTVNGIDIYEGGTFNDDWNTMSAEYSIEAIANTVIKRDNEGGGSVKMPADVGDDTVVNNKYLNEKIKAEASETDKKIEALKIETDKKIEIITNDKTITKYENDIDIRLNKVFIENGREYPIYKKIIVAKYNFIQDNVYHYIPNIIRCKRIFRVFQGYQILSGEWFVGGPFINGDGNFIRTSTGDIGKSLGIGYVLFAGLPIYFVGYRLIIEYQKEEQ